MTKSKDVVTDAQLSVLLIDKESILANGTDQAIITVQLKDSNGNDVKPSGEDKVTLISENKGTLSELTMNNDGVFTCTVSSTTVGAEKFGFSLNDVVNQNQVELKYVAEHSGLPPTPPTPPTPPKTPKPPKNPQKDVKIIVEFLCPFSRYSKGDIAGFDANYANELVEKRKVAKFYK
ncbi:hypothetical protein A9G13_02030 [Gilliamella sp. wkB178]|uniref:Ig-like domain-containing protein n=1 Tax=Gilliamella sp. wkB178 TaxID=3120259 RepID=UPI00080E35B6|nr:Ig-like domain-containing protein [Gilliamella apicola]OCG08863.1 hypothetical protein A9G13_02030 [Gilliamella apicola]